MGNFESQVSNEIFQISNDVRAIKRVLLSLVKDVQLNMTYCDVLTAILEEHELTTAEEVKELTIDISRKREVEAQAIFNKVTKKLDDVVDGQEKLEDLLTSSPVKGEA